MKVMAVMSPRVECKDDDLERAAATMESKFVRRLLVRDDAGRLGGILSLGDPARNALETRAGKVPGSLCDAD